MRGLIGAAIALLSVVVMSAPARAAEKDERAGSCDDARSQMAYFCDEKNSGSDTMVAIGTACENAKKNVAAACEGKIEADKAYKFDK
ncbi:MAG TPA: hypothetical protein VFA81_07835 [Burkholderiales bacterium]|nr:hypothetical protein [Burkholderiales bacterium]